MEKLLAYINKLGRDARGDFVARCETTEGYIRKACSAHNLLRPELCVRIEQQSRKKVTRKDLRPDDWPAIWPEIQTRRERLAAQAA